VVCDIVRSAASALDAALNRAPWGEQTPLRLLHRDVKPSNLMVDRDGELKLLDFCSGVSSLTGAAAHTEAQRAGWVKYWCPHRRQGREPGPESDVYALGVLAIELFRGRWMRRTRNTNPAHDRHLAEVVASLPDPGLRGTEDDRALRSLLLRMVAYDPDARPSAVEVVQTLRVIADRATGPTLESFAHDHALPYIESPLAVPGLPEAQLVDLEAVETSLRLSGPDDELEELLPGPGQEDPSDEDSTGTDEMAELTARALREHRRQRAASHLKKVQLIAEQEESTAWIPESSALAALTGDTSELPGEPPPEGVVTPIGLRAAQGAVLPAAPQVSATRARAPEVPPPDPLAPQGGRVMAILGALGGAGVVMILASLVALVAGIAIVLFLL
jgi:serine/threonine protein kinase